VMEYALVANLALALVIILAVRFVCPQASCLLRGRPALCLAVLGALWLPWLLQLALDWARGRRGGPEARAGSGPGEVAPGASQKAERR
jgi:hypothetical protein